MKINWQKGAVTLGQLIAALGVSAGTLYYASTLDCIIADPLTDLTCSQLVGNPEQDVYYVVSVADIENNPEFFEKSHQSLETARRSNDGQKMVIKYDAGEVPDEGPTLGNAMTNTEILEWLDDEANGFRPADDEIVKDKEKKDTRFVEDDNFIEP